MKNFIWLTAHVCLAIFSVIPYCNLFAQSPQLYGMTEFGGSNDHGVIFKYNPDQDTLSVEYNFVDSTGSEPYGSLMVASDGKMYGLTIFGGTVNYGTLFSFNPDSNTYTMLHDFNDYDLGIFPSGNLEEANNGKLYGFTGEGGQFGGGIIFGYNPVNQNYAVVHHMKNSEGTFPSGSLVLVGDGNLYGLTHIGGGYNNGTIIRFNPLSNGVTVMYNFQNSISGGQPYGSLIQATDGKFYGLTHTGGNYNYGTIFSFNIDSGTLSVLHHFSDLDGKQPTSDLIQASDGKLYGLAFSGGVSDSGTIFSYDPVADSFEVRFNFNSADGTKPFGSLLQASDGKLYGLTYTGGMNSLGTLFSFDISTNTFTKELDLDSPHGYHPFYTSLIEYNGIATSASENNSAQDHFSIYPNPTNGSFVVDLRQKDFENKSATLQVLNFLGQEIFVQKVSQTNGWVICNLPSDDAIANGIYYVKVIVSGQSYTSKLLYQNPVH